MPSRIAVRSIADATKGELVIDRTPDQCPVCKHAIEPRLVEAFADLQAGTYSLIQTIWICPRHSCRRVFLAIYAQRFPDLNQFDTPFNLKVFAPNPFAKRDFSDLVANMSPRFTAIWNQASEAEQRGLNEIAGMGYRKALEFLVKDYLISQTPDGAETIKRTALGQCIQQRLDDPKAKQCAERAAWLGNDETHYVRLWDEKDISHLKQLIELVIHWIEADALTKSFVEDMPAKPAKTP